MHISVRCLITAFDKYRRVPVALTRVMHLHTLGFRRPEGGRGGREEGGRDASTAEDTYVMCGYKDRVREFARPSVVVCEDRRRRGRGKGPLDCARLGVRSEGPSQGLQTSSTGGPLVCESLSIATEKDERWSRAGDERAGDAVYTSHAIYLGPPRIPRTVIRSTFLMSSAD